MSSTAVEQDGENRTLLPIVKAGVATAVIEQYQTVELVFSSRVAPANPFDTYLLKLELTDPSGRVFTIDGFYDGDGNGGQTGTIWKARITPYVAGTWRWRTVQGDAPAQDLMGLSGQFEATASADVGGLVADGRYFRFENGDFVYLAGNFLDFTNRLRTTHVFMSETTTDAQRDAIIARQRDFHTANKANIYFANKGDYDNQSVTPWLGTAQHTDKQRMDLARWKKYDSYIRRFKENGMLAQMWFFADDSQFGTVSEADKNRLFRYAMARTSAFSHVFYVIALEWQEDWSKASVNAAGQYIQNYNPWGRLLSVHSLTGSGWDFSGQSWPTYMATQGGNDAMASAVNAYALRFYQTQTLPHLDDEFGILQSDSDARLRANVWANFAGGAAGSGTGSDIKAFLRFLSQSRVPFQRMVPANDLVEDGGRTRFALAERGHHYVVYSQRGSFLLNVEGQGLQGYWFNPRDPNATLSAGFSVAPGQQRFTPPASTASDWTLWITNGTGLNQGVTHPSKKSVLTQIIVPLP